MEIKELDKYKPLIYQKALKYNGIGGIQFKDVHQQAYVIALESILTFNPKKGASYCTWLYMQLDRKLSKYGRREGKRTKGTEDDQDLIDEFGICEDRGYEKVDFLDFLFTSLSKRSIELIRLILDPKTEFVKKDNTKEYKKEGWKDNLTQTAIKQYLVEHGWRKCEVIKSFAEIRKTIMEWRYLAHEI